jgi:hypothetical protein
VFKGKHAKLRRLVIFSDCGSFPIAVELAKVSSMTLGDESRDLHIHHQQLCSNGNLFVSTIQPRRNSHLLLGILNSSRDFSSSEWFAKNYSPRIFHKSKYRRTEMRQRDAPRRVPEKRHKMQKQGENVEILLFRVEYVSLVSRSRLELK